MSHAEAWIDLLATAASPLLPPGPVVVMHKAHRIFPLIESCRQVAWVQAQLGPFQDFVAHGEANPSLRLRLDAQRQAAESVELLGQAALRMVCIPHQPRDAADLLRVVEACADRPGAWLVYGEPSAGGWSTFDAWLRQHALHEAADSSRLKVLMSDALLAVWPTGSRQFGPALAEHLCRRVPASVHLKLDLETASGLPRLRLRVDPLQVIACAGETLVHHVVTERRALINARGLGSLMVPWDGCASARLLLRNVRARVDDCEICIADHELSPSDLQYTEKGAILSLRLPMLAAGRDALLHLSLPRAAVPGDGFCDIGAAEFIADLA
ncbi:hypothetical protein [Ideonella paludis]|uniref:Uncharacterized protein n=1 Tax=Ideonella paludis TaxID=1233411 RepID=A0ABS5DRL8_9BURK|nr:hypothetical protein [Ideonella paludis]MBQ0933787.1 hypothetical protein [Ideonella paludis]